MQPVDRKGVFRAEIIEYGLKQMDSGSVAVSLRCKLLEMWDGKEWQPWAQYEMEAKGDVWVIKKDGNANESAAESLMQHAGWDASFSSVINNTWQPTPCQVTIEEETYKNQAQRKIGFINAWDRTPGAMSNVDEAGAQQLESRFGSTLRALRGNLSRNVPPVNRPSAPPAPPQPAGAGASNGSDTIPF